MYLYYTITLYYIIQVLVHTTIQYYVHINILMQQEKECHLKLSVIIPSLNFVVTVLVVVSVLLFYD